MKIRRSKKVTALESDSAFVWATNLHGDNNNKVKLEKKGGAILSGASFVCLARARASINKDAVEERNAGDVAIDEGIF